MPYTQANTYLVASVENGAESYSMVTIGEDGKCQPYMDANQDKNSKNSLFFATGRSTGSDNKTTMNEVTVKQSLETFISNTGNEFSAYRDENGILRVAQLINGPEGDRKYPEELDTYSVLHEDLEAIKLQTQNNEQMENNSNLFEVDESNSQTATGQENSFIDDKGLQLLDEYKINSPLPHKIDTINQSNSLGVGEDDGMLPS